MGREKNIKNKINFSHFAILYNIAVFSLGIVISTYILFNSAWIYETKPLLLL